MINTSLPVEDIAAVRAAVLRLGCTYEEISSRTRVSLSDVKRFMAGTSGALKTDQVAAAFVSRLPLRMVYHPPRIIPA